MEKVKIATTAINCCYDKKQNLEKCLDYVAQAAKDGCKLIVFPEMVLQGYLHDLTGPITPESILYQQENAELVPEGDAVQSMVAAARMHDIYIIWGMCERDRNVFDILYNTMVLVGPEGFIGAYRKVHLTMDELHVFKAGSEFPVYETAIGKIGLQICYDKCFPEASRELALGGAEILVLGAAWNDYIGDAPKDMSGKIASRYDMYDCMRAMENQAWLVSSNQYGKCGGGNYSGKSNIVDPNGYILATVGAAEGIVCAEGEIQKEIMRNRANFLQTELKHMRPDAYKRLLSGSTYYDLAAPLQSREETLKN